MVVTKSEEQEIEEYLLENEEYWINSKDFEENIGTEDREILEEEFNLQGITIRENNEGETLIPRRDLRRGLL